MSNKKNWKIIILEKEINREEKRHKNLTEKINEQDKILEEYESQRDLESDPRKKRQIEHEIKISKSNINQYKSEIEEVSQKIKAKEEELERINRIINSDPGVSPEPSPSLKSWPARTFGILSLCAFGYFLYVYPENLGENTQPLDSVSDIFPTLNFYSTQEISDISNIYYDYEKKLVRIAIANSARADVLELKAIEGDNEENDLIENSLDHWPKNDNTSLEGFTAVALHPNGSQLFAVVKDLSINISKIKQFGIDDNGGQVRVCTLPESSADNDYHIAIIKNEYLVVASKSQNFHIYVVDIRGNEITSPDGICKLVTNPFENSSTGNLSQIKSLELREISSEDQNSFITGHYDGEIIRWTINEANFQLEKDELKPKDTIIRGLFSMSLSPKENRLIAIGYSNGDIEIWQKDCKISSSLESHTAPVHVAFSPLGETLVTANKERINFWNINICNNSDPNQSIKPEKTCLVDESGINDIQLFSKETSNNFVIVSAGKENLKFLNYDNLNCISQ